jgi:hypothetical protein
MQNQHLQQDPHTNHHFPSTHPRSPTHHMPQHQQLVGPSRLHPQQSTLGNDLTQDQMEMMGGRVESPAGSHPTTSMARSPDLNPDASPSWNSAMTQMQMQGIDQYYRAQVHARVPHPDSPHPHQPSPSSIGHPSQSHSYSQELHRQQQEQMRRQQERQEAARRHSEEAEYLQNLFHPHHHHQQQQQQHQYFTLSEDHTHRHPFQMHHPAHDQRPLHSPPLIDQGYTQAHHPQIQQEQHFLVEEQEESPTMTKYGSPSLLHTPPLLLE